MALSIISFKIRSFDFLPLTPRTQHHTMAATDYFASGARPPFEQQNSGLYPPNPQFRRSSSAQPSYGYPPPPPPGYPSPQFGGVQAPQGIPGPPPYQPLHNLNDPKVHFASNSQPASPGAHRPSVSAYAVNQPNFQASPGPSPYLAGSYAPQGYLQPPQHQQSYPPPQLRPSHRSSHNETSRSGYSSDPEHDRRKHKDRSRRVSEHSRSTRSDGLMGATAGGLIGDMLFPGLGTVGGALVGWIGGKDYGKHRKWREEKRGREQDQWEKKYHKETGSGRSRSHSRDDRERNERHGRNDRERDEHQGRNSYSRDDIDREEPHRRNSHTREDRDRDDPPRRSSYDSRRKSNDR